MSTALLARRRFLPLFVTQFLGAFNDNVFKNALVILITFQAASCGDSPVLVTVAAGLFIVPFFLFSATAGQFADKFDKARMIRIIKLAEIAIMLAGALGFMLGSVELLLVVLFAMGAQSAFFGPLKYGILPQHLDEDDLMGANALIQGSTFVAILVGTIAGGLLISVPDAGGGLTAACVIAIAVAGWVSARAIPDAPAADPQLVLDRNPFRQTWRVAVMAAENRDVMVAVIGISWFWFVGATFLQLFPGFTCDNLGGGPSVVLLLLCTFTVGVAGGSWIAAKLSGGRVSLALAPLGALGLFAFALVPVVFPPAVPESFELSIAQVLANAGNWPTLLALLGLAVSGGVFVVPMFAFVQHKSPPERRARVIAAANVLNALFMVLSALMTIVLLKSGMTITGIFAVTGGGTLLILVGMLAASATMRNAFMGRFSAKKLDLAPFGADVAGNPEQGIGCAAHTGSVGYPQTFVYRYNSRPWLRPEPVCIVRRWTAERLCARSRLSRGCFAMADSQALDAGVIRGALPKSLREAAFELTVMPTVDSTNSWLSARAADAVNGTVCLAEHQFAGRGRGSRVWVSPAGCNVYLSMVWRFPACRFAGLSIAVGVCVAEACDAIGARNVSLKWPNDLIVAREEVHHKLGGILIEVAGEASAGEDSNVAVIGIGLNVDMPVEYRTAIAQPVCDLTELVGGRVSRNALVAQVLERLMLSMPLFAQQGLAPFRARFLQRDVNYDRPVRIEQGAKVSTGVARGIDETGALMVETSHGLTRIYSGDVSLRTMT